MGRMSGDSRTVQEERGELFDCSLERMTQRGLRFVPKSAQRSADERMLFMETTTRGELGRVIRILLAGAAMIVAAGVVGCQTTKGIGRDVENLGDNIEDAAEDAD